jgi:capsular exopolysaccharide synthesis family protein
MAQAWHVTDYLRILYKRRWVALAAFLLVFLMGAISSLKTTPQYEASVQLLIEQQARKNTSLDSALDTNSYYEWDGDFLPTELRILQSRALARRTISALGLWNHGTQTAEEDHGFNPVDAVNRGIAGTIALASRALGAQEKIDPPAPDETTAQSAQIGAFLGGLVAEPVRNTRLVTLRYQSPDPAFAARAVNEVAKQYIQQSIETRFLASKEANDFLAKQLEDQRRQVEASENALQRYREANGAVAIDDRQNIVVQGLADLNAAVTQAKTERIDKEAAYNRVNSLRDDPEALASFPAVLNNAFVQQLKTEVTELQRQQAQLAQRYGERHPELVKATAQLKAAEAKLKNETDKVVESVRSEFLTAQAREQSLVQALNSQRAQTLQLNRVGVEYAVLEREAASNRQLYDNLLQRAKESNVSGDFKGTNIQIVDEAEVPRDPVLPRIPRDLTVALIMGCLAAFALVFGFEQLDNRVKSPEEIQARFGLPFLGLVPSVNGRKGLSESALLGEDVPAGFAEAIKAVRTAVVFSSPDDQNRTIMVTSTAPHEGKTLVASNLAVALAQAGQRTLVIDGDLRRPRMHKVFGQEQEPGLSNMLVGDGEIRGGVRSTNVSNLWLLPAGHIPPNPAELLGSQKYEALVASLKPNYDWIVVDAPPVMAVTDASVLAHGAGGVVFVIGSEMTSRPAVRAALAQLRSARARILGAVLNRVQLEKHSYFYAPYYRKEYADYHRAEPTQTGLQGR